MSRDSHRPAQGRLPWRLAVVIVHAAVIVIATAATITSAATITTAATNTTATTPFHQPAATQPMPEPNDSRLAVPQDAYEHARLANVRPPAWRNPKPRARYALVVIGGGPAGTTAAYAAAAAGAKFALVEREWLGGGCKPRQ